MKVFSERGYQAASVEHILAEARVSRAAFYAHFESKLALVIGIAEAFVPEWQPLFDALVEIEAPDVQKLALWARRYLDIYCHHRDVCALLTQVAAMEDSLYALLAAQRDGLIHRLGDRVPIFAKALEDPLARMRVELLLVNLDQTCFLLAYRYSDVATGYGIQVMAEQILLLLASPD